MADGSNPFLDQYGGDGAPSPAAQPTQPTAPAQHTNDFLTQYGGEKPEPPPPPGNNTDSRTWRPRRDSREEVITTVRELMHLGPNDPAPVPPPLPEAEKKKAESNPAEKSPEKQDKQEKQ